MKDETTKTVAWMKEELRFVRETLSKSAANDADQKRVIDWCRGILNGDPDTLKFYGALEEDLERDVVSYVTSNMWTRADEDTRKVLIFDGKRTWRLLMRRYAWCDAMVVWNRLRTQDSPVWSAYRLTNLVLPRLWVAIFVGFLAILSSGEFLDFVGSVAKDPGSRAVLTGVSLTLASWLTFTEIQRRAGRSAGRAVVRCAMVFLGGFIQALLLIWLLMANVRYFPKLGSLDCCGGLMLASLGLVIGHIVQLFWEEDSIGDPW